MPWRTNRRPGLTAVRDLIAMVQQRKLKRAGRGRNAARAMARLVGANVSADARPRKSNFDSARSGNSAGTEFIPKTCFIPLAYLIGKSYTYRALYVCDDASMTSTTFSDTFHILVDHA